MADALGQQINEGVYQPGERLPRQPDLAREHGVTFNTLKKALDNLGSEGYLIRKVGRGTYAALPRDPVPTALVVDDDEGVRRFLAAALGRRRWQCVATESGRQALDQLKERSSDAVFLDLVMPGLNGAETFREIREIDPTAKVVIIMGDIYSTLMAQALEVGPFAVMKKPFGLAELSLALMHIADVG